jgi:hypothetical protein
MRLDPFPSADLPSRRPIKLPQCRIAKLPNCPYADKDILMEQSLTDTLRSMLLRLEQIRGRL